MITSRFTRPIMGDGTYLKSHETMFVHIAAPHFNISLWFSLMTILGLRLPLF